MAESNIQSHNLLDRRLEKLKSVIARRQFDFTVILENVHDPHNIGAVLRSCDAVGVQECYLLYTESHLQDRELEIGYHSSTGVTKWMDIHHFTDAKECFTAVRSKYDHIFATHLSKESVGLYDLDLKQSVALLFGNERDGLSEEALAYADKNFIIPQIGMVQSLNISVACAVSLFEGLRQRKKAGTIKANEQFDAENTIHNQYLQSYIDRHKTREPE